MFMECKILTINEIKINYLNKNLIKEVIAIDPDDISKDKKILGSSISQFNTMNTFR